MYDIIGDIHGHADRLEKLLLVMGYSPKDKGYRHHGRKVVFLGDFIDRGPNISRVLEIARCMVDAGDALAVMGNHELNALAYSTEDRNAPGEYLRRHSEKHALQHRATLNQLKGAELHQWLTWIRGLPLWLDLGGIRAVHACWSPRAIEALQPAFQASGGLTNDLLHQITRKGQGPLFFHVDALLKGKEARLPDGFFFLDKEGTRRTEVRTRWYLATEGHTYGSYALQTDPLDCPNHLADEVAAAAEPYPADSKPVFVGHYWLWANRPLPLATNVACLDYSVAKDGFLCAYRWDGESVLNPDHFCWC